MKTLTYHDVPFRNKHLFRIDTPILNTRFSYEDTIRFIRKMATDEGMELDFEGDMMDPEGSNMLDCIKTVQADRGHELMVVGISYSGKYVHLLILRKNLYVLGFFASSLGIRFYMDDGEHAIEGFTLLEGLKVNYTTQEQLKPVGAGAITSAVCVIQKYSESFHANEFPTYQSLERALEACFIHFAEVARFKGVQFRISTTIKTIDDEFDREELDAIELVRERNRILTKEITTLPVYALELFKNFSHLSSVWSIYFLSEKWNWMLNQHLSRKCNVRSPISLRQILGLIKPDIENVISFFKKMIWLPLKRPKVCSRQMTLTRVEGAEAGKEFKKRIVGVLDLDLMIVHLCFFLIMDSISFAV